MQNADLIITNARLVTCASQGRPKRGSAMRDVGIIEDGAVAIVDGVFADVGNQSDIIEQYDSDLVIDAGGCAVVPAFVDSHTHVVFGGNRLDEFEMRIQGKSYMEIMAAGGGIVSTMRSTRQATVDDLVSGAIPRLEEMQRLGTTTIEIKTGYGLDTESELNMLRAIDVLHARYGYRVIPTFLGAHAIPPEYKGRAEAFTQLIIDEMIPAVSSWYANSALSKAGIPLFVDVFTEENAFNLEQSGRILAAGIAAGMQVKAHVDEFNSFGGVTMAIELDAVSVDHLDVTTEEEMDELANSDTVGVMLPAVNFNLGSDHYANARKLIDAGGILALATDINPGSAPCPSMPLVMAIAARYQRLLPSETLNAVTINAAFAVGMGNELGSIEVGKVADALVLSTADYRELAFQLGGSLVDRVIRSGTVVLE